MSNVHVPDIIDFRDYQRLAMRTESVPTHLGEQAIKEHRIRHAILGFGSEGGEMVDADKRRHAYGKPYDEKNLLEEAGDLCWYLAILLDALGVPLETVLEANIAKLRARYPEKFTQEAALNRDLVNERKVLEDKLE